MAKISKTYKTFAGALKRQGVLTRVYGICPGIKTLGNNRWSLTYDPFVEMDA